MERTESRSDQSIEAAEYNAQGKKQEAIGESFDTIKARRS